MRALPFLRRIPGDTSGIDYLNGESGVAQAAFPCHLMLTQIEDAQSIARHDKLVERTWNVYLRTNNARAMYDELVPSGAKIDYELCEQPYGCREFGIQGLDGHDIAFGQDRDSDSA